MYRHGAEHEGESMKYVYLVVLDIRGKMRYV